MSTRWIGIGCAVLLAACNGPSGMPRPDLDDAGPSGDAARADGGGAPDAGGPPDAGGVADAGVPDCLGGRRERICIEGGSNEGCGPSFETDRTGECSCRTGQYEIDDPDFSTRFTLVECPTLGCTVEESSAYPEGCQIDSDGARHVVGTGTAGTRDWVFPTTPCTGDWYGYRVPGFGACGVPVVARRLPATP